MHAAQDPLSLALSAYKDGLRRFNKTGNFKTVEDEDAAIAATYGPPMQALLDWQQPARSLQAAIDALQATLDEECFIDSFGVQMIKAVLAYLRAQQQERSN